MNREFFRAAAILGLLVRAAALPLPGTPDVMAFKIWSYNAAKNPARLYGVGGWPPERRLLEYHGATTTLDYPPLAAYELAVVGGAYRLFAGARFPNTTALVVTIKSAFVLADAGCLLLIFFAIRREAGASAARWAAIGYWLNPAPIMCAAVLGYLDPFFALPAVGAIVAAAAGSPAVAGALIAAASLTKPQAIVIAPAVALGVWNGGDVIGRARRLGVAALGGAGVAVAVLAPIAAVGAFPNLMIALESLTHHDMLSGNACNLWWIVGYVMRACYTVQDAGVWTAFTTPTKILQISRFVALGYPNPRTIGTALAGGAMLWGLWTARRARDLWMTSAVAAFLLHAYATLSAQVHENHLYAAVPLLVLAAAGRRRYVPLAAVVSVIVALNLNVFYGLGEGLGYAIPRTWTIVDFTVVLAVANCAALAWHASILRREGSTAAVPRQSPAPA